MKMRSRKSLSIMHIALVILICVWLFPIHTYAVESGQWEGYVPISSADDLNAVRNDLSAKYYLTTDIVFSDGDFSESGDYFNDGAGWLPIGTDSIPFLGTFDGNGHTISGIRMNVSFNKGTTYCGIFGCNKGTIQNLKTDDIMIVAGNFADGLYLGGIAGKSRGNIIACHNEGVISVSFDSKETSGFYYVGGVCGSLMSPGKIEKSSNTGNLFIVVAGRTIHVGGICGLVSGGSANSVSVANCDNFGDISVTSTYGSELPGWAARSYCPFAGGIIGYLSGGEGTPTVLECINRGNITVDSSYLPAYAGGIVAMDDSWYAQSTIRGCTNYGSVVARSNKYSFSGGIVSDTADIILTSKNCGDVSAYADDYVYAGGIAGRANEIANCANTGSVFGVDGEAGSDISYIGGIAGQLDVDAECCYNSGHVEAASDNVHCGGVVGGCNGSVSKCSNTGYIYCEATKALLGGISGSLCKSATDCYNRGGVTLYSDATSSENLLVGGCFGKNSEATITNVYNTGAIRNTSSHGYLGGIAGYSDGTITGGYYLNNVDKAIGVGNGDTYSCSSDQMKIEGTFGDFLFSSIWSLDPAKNDGYPYLSEETVLYSLVPVSGLEVMPTELVLGCGHSSKLSVKLYPANATNRRYKWSSSDTSVATISAAGDIATLAPGTTVITVESEDGGFTGKCFLTVKEVFTISTPTSIADSENTILFAEYSKTGQMLSVEVVDTPSFEYIFPDEVDYCKLFCLSSDWAPSEKAQSFAP